ncbi:MAG: hypothetical protein R3B49_05685 [Phycisphaerales bacterium]
MSSGQRQRARSALVLFCVLGAIAFAGYQIFGGSGRGSRPADDEVRAKADRLAEPGRQQAALEQSVEDDLGGGEEEPRSMGPQSPGG